MTERRQEKEETQLFVIRLWPESFDGAHRVWRGEVAHTGQKSKRYFARWTDLLRFLCKQLGVPWEERVDQEITTEVVDRDSD